MTCVVHVYDTCMTYVGHLYDMCVSRVCAHSDCTGIRSAVLLYLCMSVMFLLKIAQRR